MTKSALLLGALTALAFAAPASAQQQPFQGLSPEGHQRLAAAMSAEASPGYSESVARARAKVLELLSAETLDLEEIAEAQAEERRLVMREHARAHARMRQAYGDLSLADRRAFAQALQMREQRLRAQMAAAKDRMDMIDRLMRYRAERVAQARQQQRGNAARQVSEEE
jgi:hypothetical protein